MLRGNGLRRRSLARRSVGNESYGGYGQRRLEEVLGRLRTWRGRGELQPERGPRKPGTRLAAAVTGVTFALLGCAMMVMLSVLDGSLVKG